MVTRWIGVEPEKCVEVPEGPEFLVSEQYVWC